ncbi:DUF4145 domain-containing protein [Limosilactobacillus reuteri]|uniref:DUF4145 domain-containing protein n=1 Tax=Lactobacillaceae TaxID=33958 RepID=UPI00254E7862|nr:DUF4145 domain-containing protein [Lactiplantibacillus plantarum]
MNEESEKERAKSIEWEAIQDIDSATYTCAYCGQTVSSNQGIIVNDCYNGKKGGIFMCSLCKFPTYLGPDFNGNNIQSPNAKYGNSVSDVPDSVNHIYEEMRSSYSVGAYTGTILLARTLLNHIGVNFGAKENQGFQYYVEYLFNNGYLPHNSKDWVDKIREFGNKATHRLVVNTKKDAQLMIKFCEMILKINYEYNAVIKDE